MRPSSLQHWQRAASRGFRRTALQRIQHCRREFSERACRRAALAGLYCQLDPQRVSRLLRRRECRELQHWLHSPECLAMAQQLVHAVLVYTAPTFHKQGSWNVPQHLLDEATALGIKEPKY